MGVAKRSFSPSMMTSVYEKDFSDSEESSLEIDRSTILDGQNVDSEALICLPGQIDIRCYMLPTKPVKPVMDLVADEEAARAMGLDSSLEEMEDVQHMEDLEDPEMAVELPESSFSADEEAAVAMGLSSSFGSLEPSPAQSSPSATEAPLAEVPDAPADAPADTPVRPKRKSQTVLGGTPEKKVRVVVPRQQVQDKMGKLDKSGTAINDILAETVHRPAEVGEVL
mmetsp:Transcript_70342/g.111118  ORF Transcript_70342/g.111118 Transcript_70342/m.111118 type:complete len:225 (+) Transcript_70342:61-735(+)